MPANPLITRLLDAGMHLTEMSQSNAENLVKELVRSGMVRRKEAEKTVQALVERGRSSSEQLVATIQQEVQRQLARMGDRVDEVESRLDEVVTRLTPRSARRAAPSAVSQDNGDATSAGAPS